MTLADLNVKISYLNDLKKGLAGIERDLRSASRRLAAAGNEISMSLSAPLALFGATAVQTAAQMESLKLAMRTTFQDAGRSIEAADKELEALRKSALAPGLDFEQAVKASIRLQGVGMSAENARGTIEQLANAISMSGGTADDLDGVTIQMAQMISKGKVLAADLRIIQERMPKITSLMQEAFGVKTADQLQELGVTGEEFVAKITAKMQELPRVSGGLANSIVNMGAAVKSFLATVGDDIATTFDLKTKFENFGTWLQGVATWFKGLSANTKEWILYVGAAVVAIGPLLKVMAALSSLSAQVIGAFGNVVNALKLTAGKALEAAKAFQALSLAQKATVVGLGIAAIVAFTVAINEMSDGIGEAARTRKMLNDVQLQAAQSIIAERLEAEKNIATIKDETKSKADKQKALEKLIEVGGDYFAGLSIEKSSVTEITAAYDKYIANLLSAARAKAAQEKIIDIEKQRLELADQLQKKQDEFARQGALARGFFSAAGGAGTSVQDALAKQIAELEAQQKALSALMASAQSVGQGSKNTAPSSTTTISTKQKSSDRGNKSPIAAQAEEYQRLNTEVERLPALLASVQSASAPVLETHVQMANIVGKVSDAYRIMSYAISDAALGASESMQQMAQSGESSFRALGKAALKGAADVLRANIIKGVSSLVSQILEKYGATGPLAIALAGGLGAAAGVMFSKLIKSLKIPAFADGATVTSPTLAMFGEYPGAASNPEHSLRHDQLKGLIDTAVAKAGRSGNVQVTGTIRASGRDLLVVLENAQVDKYRMAGG